MATPARVRFAPSPTGFLHLGGARTALYNFLLARQTGGQFILRIEDTDRKRLVAGAYEDLLENLRWLGLEWDEGPIRGGPHGPYFQSERKEIYLEQARRLVEGDQAYYCFCSPERLADLKVRQQQRKEPPRYDGLCRRLAPAQARARAESGEPHVVRFKTPSEGSTTVRDLLRGEITVENRNLDDFILLKSDGLALYHLAAMVDDHHMGITHVIRGSEWLPSLPFHALIHRAFGWEEPIWCHLSVFLKPSGRGKMSKRESSELLAEGHSIFVRDLRELGYIQEGVLNWIALMGASFDEKRDVFSLGELIERFSLAHLNPAPASINFAKQDHFNGVHIRLLSPDDLAQRLVPFFAKAGLEPDLLTLRQVTPLIQERMVSLCEGPEIAGFFFCKEVHPDPQDLLGKGLSAPQSADALRAARELLSSFASLADPAVETRCRELAAALQLEPRQLFGILRAAVTGQTVSPPLFGTMAIVGKEQVLRRLEEAEATLRRMT
ncbi:MAG: glutamate--tRNA ligase [Anaerolineales bacterium]|jgi:glutamyl-tRNA synthetase